jgi:hypothetical protein
MASIRQTSQAYINAAVDQVQCSRFLYEIEFYIHQFETDYEMQCEVTRTALHAIKNVTAQWIMVDPTNWKIDDAITHVREATQLSAKGYRAIASIRSHHRQLEFSNSDYKAIPEVILDLDGYCDALPRLLLERQYQLLNFEWYIGSHLHHEIDNRFSPMAVPVPSNTSSWSLSKLIAEFKLLHDHRTLSEAIYKSSLEQFLDNRFANWTPVTMEHANIVRWEEGKRYMPPPRRKIDLARLRLNAEEKRGLEFLKPKSTPTKPARQVVLSQNAAVKDWIGSLMDEEEEWLDTDCSKEDME